jgi:hypothetical protein
MGFPVRFQLMGPVSWQSKKRCIPVSVPSARYSLVKGERIVRSVLSTRLVESEPLGAYPYTIWLRRERHSRWDNQLSTI